MAKSLHVKFKYQDDIQIIEATRVEEKLQRLLVYNGAEQVASLGLETVENWWLAEDKARATKSSS